MADHGGTDSGRRYRTDGRQATSMARYPWSFKEQPNGAERRYGDCFVKKNSPCTDFMILCYTMLEQRCRT